MKVLTLWEPWATLLVHGVKVFETRSWETGYRGPILIHAAKRWGDDQKALCSATSFRLGLQEALGKNSIWRGWPPAKNRGCIIGLVDLVGCRRITPREVQSMAGLLTSGAMRELDLGDWTGGRFAWQFSPVRTVLEPIPARGRQRIWNWDGDVSTLREKGAA